MRPVACGVMMSWAAACVAQTADTTATDREDTLHTVVVTAQKELGVLRNTRRSLEKNKPPHVRTLGEILNERFPNLMDCIMHPFAIKARKRERRQKKLQKILREYEMTKTPNELLLEAIQAEQLRDSLMRTD